jgi:hypothetical protein
MESIFLCMKCPWTGPVGEAATGVWSGEVGGRTGVSIVCGDGKSIEPGGLVYKCPLCGSDIGEKQIETTN